MTQPCLLDFINEVYTWKCLLHICAALHVRAAAPYLLYIIFYTPLKHASNLQVKSFCCGHGEAVAGERGCCRALSCRYSLILVKQFAANEAWREWASVGRVAGRRAPGQVQLLMAGSLSCAALTHVLHWAEARLPTPGTRCSSLTPCCHEYL